MTVAQPMAGVAGEEIVKDLITGNASEILAIAMILEEVELPLIHARQSMTNTTVNMTVVTATVIRTTGSENETIHAPVDTETTTEISGGGIPESP